MRTAIHRYSAGLLFMALLPAVAICIILGAAWNVLRSSTLAGYTLMENIPPWD